MKMEPGQEGEEGKAGVKSPRTLFLALFLAAWIFAIIYVPLVSYRLVLKRWSGKSTPRGIFDLDFKCYMLPGLMLRDGNLNIYSYDQENHYFSRVDISCGLPGSISYPPPFYVMMIPLGRLPLFAAADVWLLLKYAALLWAALLMTYMLIGERAPPGRKLLLALFLVATLYAFSPTQDDIYTGQVNVHLLFLLCLSLYLIDRKLPVLGGMVLGLIFWIKLIAAFIIIYYAMKKQWKVVIPAAAVIVLVALAVSAAYSPRLFTDYFSVIRSNLEMGKYMGNMSIQLRLMLLLNDLGLIRILYLLISLPIIGAVFYRLAKANPAGNHGYAYSLLLAATLVTAPVVWTYHQVWFFIPLCLIGKDLLSRQFKDRGEWLAGALFITIYLTMAVFHSVYGDISYWYEIFQWGIPFANQLLLGIMIFRYPPERLALHGEREGPTPPAC